MKIKGLRWYIIGLIMMITIINYLDRGTLNYMWVANIDYELVEKQPIDMSSNVAVKTDKGYRLFSTRGDDMIVDEGSVTIKQKDAATIVTNKEGIAIDLGLIDRNDPDASKKAKDILGDITIFFMIAYGISQLVSGRLYDKVGCRKGFFGSVLIWGLADALAAFSTGKFSLTAFRMMLGLGEAGPWPGTTKEQCGMVPTEGESLCTGTFRCGSIYR